MAYKIIDSLINRIMNIQVWRSATALSALTCHDSLTLIWPPASQRCTTRWTTPGGFDHLHREVREHGGFDQLLRELSCRAKRSIAPFGNATHRWRSG